MDKNLPDEYLIATLKRLERFADLTDSKFRIPFTNIRFGIDAVIGLIPFAGETIGLVLSLYLVLEAHKLGVPLFLKLKMLRNIAIDWIVGLVPILGDIADVAYKANIRNLKLLVEHINQEYQRRNQPLKSGKVPGWLLLSIGAVLVVATCYLLMRVIQGMA